MGRVSARSSLVRAYSRRSGFLRVRAFRREGESASEVFSPSIVAIRRRKMVTDSLPQTDGGEVSALEFALPPVAGTAAFVGVGELVVVHNGADELRSEEHTSE